LALGHKVSSVSGEERETSFLFHRLSLQRFSAVLLHDTFNLQDDPDQLAIAVPALFLLLLTLGNYTPKGFKNFFTYLLSC